MCDETELKQEGFDAIAHAVRRLYPNQDGRYYGTLLPYSLGGGDPLDGVEVWESERGLPHWHYITYGFTELYEKESDDAEVSGYGFELTFRLKREGEEEPPAWPINLLQNLARYVFSSGHPFGSGHHMSCNGPIALETDTQLTALGFRVDPELGELDTSNGRMTFLQAVGITQDEMDAMMCWKGEKFLAALEQQLPLCVADLSRGSQMNNPDFERIWRAGMERDGSSTGFLYMDALETGMEEGRAESRSLLRLGAGHTHILAHMLRARVGKGQELYVQGEEAAVQFQPGLQTAAVLEGKVLVLTLTEKGLEELCACLKPQAGTCVLTSLPLTLNLVPTRIKDRDGNVVQVIE
ncbi:MAG: suppressor of fused domain protein [Clostridiales bacterium]|nr:suppressor of fused domain protein [Clostridiales bacterium]